MQVLGPQKVEIKRNGKWEAAEYNHIKAGDNFKIYEEYHQLFLTDMDGEGAYYAASEPYYDDELGVWLINIK